VLLVKCSMAGKGSQPIRIENEDQLLYKYIYLCHVNGLCEILMIGPWIRMEYEMSIQILNFRNITHENTVCYQDHHYI